MKDNYGSGKACDIQILRICACISVFAVHMGQRLELTGKIRTLCDLGAYGPYLFFILSGLCTFMSFERKKVNFSFKSYGEYLLHRALRILPIYYVVVMIEFLLRSLVYKEFSIRLWKIYLFRYGLMLSGILAPKDGFNQNLAATWSISVFCLFYFFAPLLWKLIHSLKIAGGGDCNCVNSGLFCIS